MENYPEGSIIIDRPVLDESWAKKTSECSQACQYDERCKGYVVKPRGSKQDGYTTHCVTYTVNHLHPGVTLNKNCSVDDDRLTLDDSHGFYYRKLYQIRRD